MTFSTQFLTGNHYVQVEGGSYVLIITTPNFKCESLSSFAKIGFLYKMNNGQVVFKLLLVLLPIFLSSEFDSKIKILYKLVLLVNNNSTYQLSPYTKH
jgi:hypothetical protein